MKKSFLALLLSVVLLMSLVACSGSSSPSSGTAQPTPPQSAEAAPPSEATTPEQEKEETRFFSIASSESGSFQYMYMAAFAGTLRSYMPYLNLTNEATSGTSENLDLLYRKEVGICLSSPERLYNAYNGIDSYEEKGKLNCGILWCYMQQSALLITKKDSGINGFADLAGKKVCIGAAGSSNEIKNCYILDAYGYTRKDPDGFEYNELQTFSIDYGQGATALSEGTVDAIVATRPLPEPAIYELALVTPISVIPLDQNKYDDIRKIYPWMWESTVPAEIYPGQAEMQTLGDPNYVVASLDDISEEDAYNMTKAYVEEILPQLAEQFEPLKPYASDPSLLTSSWVIPGHPGAVKYFTENGYDVSVTTP